MRTAAHLSRFARLMLLAVALVMVTPNPARAVSGVYIELGGGASFFDTNEMGILTTEDLDLGGMTLEQPNNAETPPTSGAATFRLGYSVFGVAGAEFMFVGSGWRDFEGGGGFIGGGIRLYPLGIFQVLGLLDDEFPVDLSVAGGFGYTIVGQDAQYEGTFWSISGGLDYRVTSWFSVGAHIDILLPNYSNFVVTNRSADRGVCLDSTGQISSMSMSVSATGEIIGDERGECSDVDGRGPNVTVFVPQLVLTFSFLGL